MRGRGTLVVMSDLKRSVLTTTEAALPRGRVMRLRVRLTVDLVVTAAITLLAVGASLGYQLMRLWASRSHRP
jgi:hypothetical protein